LSSGTVLALVETEVDVHVQVARDLRCLYLVQGSGFRYAPAGEGAGPGRGWLLESEVPLC